MIGRILDTLDEEGRLAKTPTGALYGEPVPKEVVFYYYGNRRKGPCPGTARD